MKALSELLGSGEHLALMRKLVHCIAQAYADARDLHHPEVGSDARTFGMSVYTFVWHRLGESGLVRVTSKEPYWFEFDTEMVASHRVTGPTPGADIHSCFPRDREGWPSTVNRQGAFEFSPQPGVTNNVLVLAHRGDSATGLLDVHLCRPFVDEHGSLVRWEEAAVIWERGAEEATPPGVPATEEQKPAEENKPKPVVTPKKKRKDTKDAGDAAE